MFSLRLGALALAAALAAPVAASAQTAPQPAPPANGAPAPNARGHHHGGRLMRALHDLNLSPDQQTQIAGIMKSARENNKNADPDTRKAAMRDMRKQIAGVLTPDQRTQLRASMARHRHAQQNGTAPAAPQAPTPQN